MQHKVLITTVRDLYHDGDCGTSIHAIVVEFVNKAAADKAVSIINSNPANDKNYFQTALALY